MALKRLNPNKGEGPDGVCPRLLRFCADQLAVPLQRLFTLSLWTGIVPDQWKTSCIVPVPKNTHPTQLNDYRPVALTSHIMKTLERLALDHLKPLTRPAQDPLQFGYQHGVGVEDAVLYLIHRTYSHLEVQGCQVRITFFDFSSAFNTIRPTLLKEKLSRMEVPSFMIEWIMDYLRDRPQYVRLASCVSDTAVCNTGAPQGTVLAPYLFTLYTSDFSYNSETCHVQKYSDDTALVARVKDGKEAEYRGVVSAGYRFKCQESIRFRFST